MASDLVCIKTFAHRFEADIALSFLQAQGIPAMIDAQDLAATSPHLMLAAGGARLLVRTEDAQAALEMLEADPASVDDLEI
ncbi:MAG: hypothetical protein V4671_26990 [Armatimonadota bacterium]